MEFSLDKLDDAIYFFLSMNKDTQKSVQQIYNGLTTEKICPGLLGMTGNLHDTNKKHFISICNTMDSKFEDIVKVTKDNTVYLTFTQKPEVKQREYNNINEELFEVCIVGNVEKCEQILNNHIIDYSYMSNNQSFYDVLPSNSNGILLCKLLSTNQNMYEINKLNNINTNLKEINTKYLEELIRIKKENYSLTNNNSIQSILSVGCVIMAMLLAYRFI